jgi:tetratricopeptide (TPR) repeat protein
MFVMSFSKKILFAILPFVLSGCLTIPDPPMNRADEPAAIGAVKPPVKSAPKASEAPKPWPPYLATYHYSLGVLNNLEDNHVEAVKEFEAAFKYDPQSAQIAAELASAYAEKGEMLKAMAVCEKSLLDNPDDIELNMILGGLTMSTRDFKRAILQYRKVLALSPKNINAHLYLGTVYSDEKQYKEAINTFNALLAIDPGHLMGNYYRGKILVEMENYGEAEKAFKKTLSIRPTFDSALIELALAYEKQKKSDLAIETLKDYLSLYPDRLNARIKLGELLLRNKQYDDAEREFNKILKANRNNRDVRLTMGLLYLESGRHDQAIETFSDLIKNFPEDHRFVYLLASAYEEKKDSGRAIEQLKTIPVKSDLYGNAQLRIAMIMKKQGQLKEAVLIVEQAIKSKKDPSLYAILSSLQEDNKDVQAAEKTLKEGLSVFPENVELYYTLGVLYEKTNKFDDSIRQMDAVLRIDPNHADALNFIGYSYADRGINLDEAEKMIKKALRFKPGSGYIIDSLGWLYFRQNKIDEALKYLQEAYTALPGDSAIAEHLGDVFFKAGRIKEALDAYQKALKLAPDNKTIQKKLHELQKK